MRAKTKVAIVAGAAVMVAGAVATVSVATGGDDSPLTGSALERATAVALEHTGGVRVVESEAGEGDAAYEVGVLLDDGSVVEVQLDTNFEVTGSGIEPESESSEGSGESGTSEEGGADDGS